MPDVNCQICRKVFYVKPSHQKLGFGKYCSIECRSESQKRGSKVNCYICSKEVWKSPKELERSKSGLYFCSKLCQTKWRNSFFSGENHSNWNCGKTIYRKMLIDSGKEMRCRVCEIDDKRVLTAHHKDLNRNNNQLDNLEWLCLNCHHIEHAAFS